MIREQLITQKSKNMKLILTNLLTGEVFPVADFVAEGDLLIAMNALQQAAPKHLEYSIEKPKPIRWNFNFVGGGWNSVVALTKQAAIDIADEKYGGRLKIDYSTFRPATDADDAALAMSFY